MRFKVLGSIEVERDDAKVALGGPQQRRLLGVLLVGRGRQVSMEHLVDALWPNGDAPDGAPRSVLTYVSRLRAAVGDGHVVTQGRGYRLMLDSATCDLDEFESLLADAGRALPNGALECYERALSLWEGDAFGEFAREWWALSESTRLAELRVLAHEERAAALMAVGHEARAVPALEGLIVEQPFRERPVVLLMQALMASGRRAEALRAFHSYRVRLGQETGLVPSAQLVELERTIAASLEPSGDVSLGRPLRGYVIHGPIGEGRYGRVYAATQPGTERRVAIKAIRPDLADSSEFIRRFEAEARLVARLEHPHIVPLYDYWREPGGAYLVFRFLAGGTARDSVVTGGAWSVQRVSQLVEEVGGALIAAHAAGVQHNDVKASNVMLDDRGGTYLTDFGIAVRAEEPASAPDWSRGDVRALGWLLWELLTGAAHGPGSTTSSLLDRRAKEAVPSLVGRAGVVPRSLDAVLAKATDPDGGYETVAELVLGWRAAVGRPEGVLSPVGSDDRRVIDSARRAAAARLTETTAAGVNPYKGLRPFDEADTAEFFGRHAVVDALEASVNGRRFVTVVGASGSGKSSLVRAGLVPRLRACGNSVVTIVPGDDPIPALREALLAVSTRGRKTADLTMMVRHVIERDVEPSTSLVVVVDQLEELWTRCEREHRAGFLDVVARLVDGDAEVRFVATIRADVFDRPLEDPRIGGHVGAGAFVLAPMSPAQLGDAITLPAARAGVTVDEAVVVDLVTEAAAQPGSLPLLQFTLAELYDRRVDGRIGVDALVAVGGMAGSIGRRAETVYAGLGEHSQADTRTLFSRLVTPGDGTPDGRRRARLSELSEGARAVAGDYVDARLLVTDRDQSTREPTLDVAHEALLSRWSRLAEWIDEDRRWLAQLQHLAVAARAWDERGRLPTDLYRGARLEGAIEALDGEGQMVSDTERQFVDAGRDARDAEIRSARRAARRLRRFLVASVVGLVIALAAGLIAYRQQQRAETNARQAVAEREAADLARRAAALRGLVSDSVALRTNQRELAALLAVEAHRISPSAATESALFGTFTAAPGLERTVLTDGGRDDGALLLDASTIVIAEESGLVHVADVATGAERYSLNVPRVQGEEGTTWVAATPDGRYLATAWQGADPTRGELAVWDLETRTKRFANVDTNLNTGAIAISPDGSTVVVGGGTDVRTVIFDAATGARRAEIEPIPRPDDAQLIQTTVALAFTSDGQLVIGSQAGPIRLIDPATAEELRRIDGPRETSEVAIRMSADGRSMVTAGWRGHMRYDIESGDPLWPRPAEVEGCVESIALAERIAEVLCGEHESQRVRAIDLDTGAIIDPPIVHRSGYVCAVLNSPDGTLLIEMSCGRDSYALWRVDGGGAASRLVAPAADGQFVFGYTVDGRQLLAQQADGNVQVTTQVVDPRDGSVVALPGVFGPIPTDDPSLVIASFGDGTAGVYDLDAGRVALRAADPGFTPFGAVVNGDDVVVWGAEDNEDGTFRRAHLVAAGLDGFADSELESTEYYHVAAVFPDPAHLVTIDCWDGCWLQRRDPSTLAPIGDPVRGDTDVSAIAGEGGVLVAVGSDGQAVVLDPDTLHRIGGPLPGTGGPPSVLVISDDGRRLLEVGADATLRLYDIPSRTQLGDDIPVGISDGGAALRPDGLEAAVMTDQGIVVWDLDPEHWIDAACGIAGRNMTRAEWDQYVGDLASYRPTCPQYATS